MTIVQGVVALQNEFAESYIWIDSINDHIQLAYKSNESIGNEKSVQNHNSKLLLQK